MTTTSKKKAVKKAAKKKPARRAAPMGIKIKQMKGYVKYADPRLKPLESASTVHPAYTNNPDIVHLLPGCATEIKTGLEIAVPPEAVIIASSTVDGLFLPQLIYTGYQKELVLKFWNNTSMNINIDPYSRVANLHLASIISWHG